MSDLDMAVPLTFTDAAANKVKSLISEEENNELKLRVYITGGGCSGFQYGFTFDDKVNEGDLTIEKAGVQLVIDPMSLQYLIGGTVDYTEGEQSKCNQYLWLWFFIQHLTWIFNLPII